MKTKLLWLINGVLLGICIYLFFALFEPYQKEIDSGWSDAARRNPFLAAQQYLEAQGITSHTVDTLKQGTDLEAIETLYIEDSRAVLSSRQVETLMQWIRAGGHLIITAHPQQEDSRDPLLDTLQITVERSECDCPDTPENSLQTTVNETSSEDTNTSTEKQAETKQESENTDAPKKPAKAYRPLTDWLRKVREGNTKGDDTEPPVPDIYPVYLTELHFEGIEETLTVHFSTYWSLSHPYLYTEDDEDFPGLKPFYWTGSDWGVHFMQFQMGEGMMSVTTDSRLWTSAEIDDHDNAYLLSILTDGSQQLYFLARNQMPSLFILLWQHSKEIIIAFACWLSLWLLYRGRRFLPPLKLTSTARRSIAEHIQAVAHFFWQRQAIDKLLETQREEIQLRASTQVHGYAGLTPSQQLEALAHHCDMPVNSVMQAMTSDNSLSEDHFLEMVQFLQKIRSTL